ncbi:MAG: phage terminase large subunit family protein [Thiohalorhabdus sp.]
MGPEAAHNLRRRLQGERQRHLSPPPKLTISQWADRERYLSPESSSMPGRWRTDHVEPARGVMDAVSDPAVHTVTAMVCTQLLKTEVINNVVGYHIHQDPAPILVMQPTLEMAAAWSKDRLSPMVRDSPALQGTLGKPRAKDSENTIYHKKFAGGHLSVIGSNSPASLASRPIRIVLADEVDRYEVSAKSEGDPIRLAAKRQETFWNRKRVETSSPTIKGASRIEASFETSDQRRYYVPCPHCGDLQLLQWAQVQWPEGQPDQAAYACASCGTLWSEADRLAAVQRGEWRQTAPFHCCGEDQDVKDWADEVDAAGCRRAVCAHCGGEAPFRGHAGFHLNRLASPWTTLADVAQEFIDAKREGPESLKVFVNTALAETWEEEGEGLETDYLLERREEYPSDPVPDGVLLLTAGVDVQDDRLELEIVGWGVSEETWSLDYRVLYGDPSGSGLWQELDEVLRGRYEHPSGMDLRIESACVDSGGHHTQAVYDFCRPRYGRVFAIKGQAGQGRPIWPEKANKSMARKLPVFMVGVDTAKDLVYNRLQVLEPGPGFCHFPARYDQPFFDGLTAEQKRTRYSKGFPVQEWVLPSGVRNEPLDCRVYATAARRAKNIDLQARARAVQEAARGNTQAARKAVQGRRSRRRIISKGIS